MRDGGMRKFLGGNGRCTKASMLQDTRMNEFKVPRISCRFRMGA